ncbi:thioredoxin domain-containing protein [Pedobacter nyackensis]|uniref:thioredoxin domain-containing protein n=1 Tax=Pedobacter nyackensis TaxID=475255 RepID=UPI00292DACC2|nr:thioredoxin domain-containing protein [Pedobacter nyackensis]
MKAIRSILLAWLFGVSTLGYAQNNPGESKKEFLTTVAVFSKKIAEQKNPQILDARSAEEFDQVHLKGAINVNPSVKGFEQIFNQLEKDQPVFIYSIQSGRSSGIGQLLRQEGFREIYVLSPGIASWIGSGNEVVVRENHKSRVTPADFKGILTSKNLVLVDYGSNYCPPCKKVIPVLDSLTNTPGNKVKTFVLEIDANPEIIKAYQITTIPTLILYRDGKPVWKKTGVPSLTEINHAIASNGKTLLNRHIRTTGKKAAVCTQSNLPARFGLKKNSTLLTK